MKQAHPIVTSPYGGWMCQHCRTAIPSPRWPGMSVRDLLAPYWQAKQDHAACRPA